MLVVFVPFDQLQKSGSVNAECDKLRESQIGIIQTTVRYFKNQAKFPENMKTGIDNAGIKAETAVELAFTTFIEHQPGPTLRLYVPLEARYNKLEQDVFKGIDLLMRSLKAVSFHF